MTTKQIPENPVMSKLEHLMQRLARESFYGEVNIIFQNGKPLLVKVNQTYKMNDL
jgi:hypothetical protein